MLRCVLHCVWGLRFIIFSAATACQSYGMMIYCPQALALLHTKRTAEWFVGTILYCYRYSVKSVFASWCLILSNHRFIDLYWVDFGQKKVKIDSGRKQSWPLKDNMAQNKCRYLLSYWWLHTEQNVWSISTIHTDGDKDTDTTILSITLSNTYIQISAGQSVRSLKLFSLLLSKVTCQSQGKKDFF